MMAQLKKIGIGTTNANGESSALPTNILAAFNQAIPIATKEMEAEKESNWLPAPP